MIWARRRQANPLRSALREFYPAAPQPAWGAALSPHPGLICLFTLAIAVVGWPR